MKIYTKVITIQLLILIGVMIAFGLVTIKLSYRSLNDELQSKSEVVLKRFSNGVVTPLWNFNNDEVITLADLELLDNDVSSIIVSSGGDVYGRIVLEDGKIVDYDDKQSYEQIDDAFIVLEGEILKGKDKLGSVKIYFTEYNIRE